jgi:hypothetical protein
MRAASMGEICGMSRPASPRRGHFWSDKTPCWILRGCVEVACDTCVAFRNRARPCWEQDTLCKRLLDMESCYACVVYRLYAGQGKPAERGPAGADLP